MSYVLIILSLVFTDQVPVMVPFSTKTACENAASVVKQNSADIARKPTLRTICVPQ